MHPLVAGSYYKDMVAGFVASVCCTIVLYPLETWRTRLQTGEPVLGKEGVTLGQVTVGSIRHGHFLGCLSCPRVSASTWLPPQCNVYVCPEVYVVSPVIYFAINASTKQIVQARGFFPLNGPMLDCCCVDALHSQYYFSTHALLSTLPNIRALQQ